jgi:hypothetical protein
MGRRVIVNYACELPVLVPRLSLLPLHTHPEYTMIKKYKELERNSHVTYV